MDMVIEQPPSKRIKLSVSVAAESPCEGVKVTCSNNDSSDEMCKQQAHAAKYQMMKNKLTMAFHAHYCQDINCSKSCIEMKRVIQHLNSCRAGKTCPDGHCRSMRQLLEHFKHCQNNDCQLCPSVRESLQEERAKRTNGLSAEIVPHQQQAEAIHSVESNDSDQSLNSSSLPQVKTEERLASSGAKRTITPAMRPYVQSEMVRVLLPTWKAMYHLVPHSLPFRQPVDPIRENIPDYLLIVKNPMDLATIRGKLETGQYMDPWQYVEDVQLMFKNAWTYNKRSSPVYKSCTKLAEKFESIIDGPMRELGCCCGQRPIFRPLVLYCASQHACAIPVYATYYNFRDKYAFCEKCFGSRSGSTVEVVDFDDQAQPVITLRKEQFVREVNMKMDPEPYVYCKCCNRRQHQICVLHIDQIWPSGYVCQDCLQLNKLCKKANLFVASKLVNTKLGTHLEDRVNSFLLRHGIIDGDSEEGRVTVRVLSSSEKYTEVKPGMRSHFPDAPPRFPYISKSIFAFQMVEGIDVCIFGLHVQEYGTNCPVPNQRRIYIAYLDSVNFFRPKHLRTTVYQEILIGYLSYVRSLGYLSVHIWACPPGDADEYIFHRHPPDQKMPKPKRLQEWYRKLLDKAVAEGAIYNYKDIVSDTFGLTNVTEIPYFDGDFWPNVLEEAVQDDRRAGSSYDDMCFDEEDGSSSYGKTKGGKAKKNGKCKKSSKTKKVGFMRGASNQLVGRILNAMDKHREVFFVIHLQSLDFEPILAISDPDIFIPGDLMDTRASFLMFCRERRLEFSSLRRAKFSSMVILHRLHCEQEGEGGRRIFKCQMCSVKMTQCYTCSECEEFNVCSSCYETHGHEHKVTKRGAEIDSKLLRCIETLAHAAQCNQDANCPQVDSCRRMASVLSHAQTCKLRNSCPVCRQFIALCVTHARQCTIALGNSCPVPFCAVMRQNLDRRRLMQSRQQQQMVDCRLAMMSANSQLSSSRNGADSVLTNHSSEPLASDTIPVHSSAIPLPQANDDEMPTKAEPPLIDGNVRCPANCETDNIDTKNSWNSAALSDHMYSSADVATSEASPQQEPDESSSIQSAAGATTPKTSSELVSPKHLVNPVKIVNRGNNWQRLVDIGNHIQSGRVATNQQQTVSIRASQSNARNNSVNYQQSFADFLTSGEGVTHIFIRNSSGTKTVVEVNSSVASVDTHEFLAELADHL